MTKQFWRHQSGEIFAVVVDEAGRVVAGSEALDQREYAKHSVEEFETLPENAEWFNEHGTEFSLFDPRWLR